MHSCEPLSAKPACNSGLRLGAFELSAAAAASAGTRGGEGDVGRCLSRALRREPSSSPASSSISCRIRHLGGRQTSSTFATLVRPPAKYELVTLNCRFPDTGRASTGSSAGPSEVRLGFVHRRRWTSGIGATAAEVVKVVEVVKARVCTLWKL
jgi:hypothetical protein